MKNKFINKFSLTNTKFRNPLYPHGISHQMLQTNITSHVFVVIKSFHSSKILLNRVNTTKSRASPTKCGHTLARWLDWLNAGRSRAFLLRQCSVSGNANASYSAYLFLISIRSVCTFKHVTNGRSVFYGQKMVCRRLLLFCECLLRLKFYVAC